ncbi:hypothetical protein [Treponema sp.]|uniref:hypothetical protein n=1 Tax=Treponema sp. TaxID=166 RepID=UPI00388FD1C8
MKKFSFLLVLVSGYTFFSANAAVSELERQFIKGNITEKTELVQKSASSTENLSLTALDYVIENAPALGEDLQLKELALAAVVSLNQTNEQIEEKLSAIFYSFTDETIRVEILNKFNIFQSESNTIATRIINDYLTNAFNSGFEGNPVIKSSIVCAGRFGNQETLNILYNILHAKKWPLFTPETENSFVNLSKKYEYDTIKILSGLEFTEAAEYFTILSKSEQISQIFLCEVAENMLFSTITKAETLQETSKEYQESFADLQILAMEILSKNKWSHASEAVNSTVKISKKEYEDKILSEEKFIQIITYSISLPTSELAQILSGFLAECNGKVELASSDTDSRIEMPAKQVVLALIKALGSLGDKTAFDNLLYVTYLNNYPVEVIEEAKTALTSLKW